MHIDIFYKIKDICIKKLDNKIEENTIYDIVLDTIDSINIFIESNKISLSTEEYYIITELINELFNNRKIPIEIEDKDFKMAYRFKAKQEVKKYIEKLTLGKKEKNYQIDLDDLDDIEFLLKEYDLDMDKIIIYELLADIYYNNRQYEKEYEYLLKAWELTNRYSPEKTNYRIAIKLANNYIDSKKYNEAIRLYEKILIEIDYIPEKYKLNLYYNYALANAKIKMYSFALGILEDLLKYTELEDYNLWANSYILNGLANYYLGNYEQSIVDYNKALQVLSFVGYTNLKELIYYNIAVSYIELNDRDSAHKYIEGILEGLSGLEEDPSKKITALYKLGRIYNILDNYEESEKYFKKSLELAMEFDDKENILLNISDLVELNKRHRVEKLLDIIDINLEYICEDIQNIYKLKELFKVFNLYLSENENEKLQNIINKILEII